MDLNKVMIIGRLTRDPESRTIPSGQTVATFGVATNRQWTNQATGEKQSQVEYHNIVAWRRLAEICAQYLRKGSQVYVEGHLQTRSWDDPSGVKRYRTEVVMDNMIMLGGQQRNVATAGQYGDQAGNQFNGSTAPAAGADNSTVPTDVPSPPQPTDTETISVEDIPF